MRHFNWIHLITRKRFAVATHKPAQHPPRAPAPAAARLATHFGNRIVTPIQARTPAGDFERLFSYTHHELLNLFEESADQFDLRVMKTDEDTALRGVANLGIDLPALENRRQLITVIDDHVRRYLAIYYPSDAPPSSLRRAGSTS